VASSDQVPVVGAAGARRRARVAAARSASVRVRLTPDEAAVIGEAAARAGMSVGAWVGDTAVGRARAEAAVDKPDETGRAGLLSWRELVAALVALRAEVAARRTPDMTPASAAPVAEQFDRQACSGTPGRSDLDDVVEVLQRVDAVTATAVEARSSRARRSSPGDTQRSGRS
jgi:uncharacterized protein (DUF1778 family)